MFSDEKVESIRNDLPVVSHVTYLNAGTLGPLPQCTIDTLKNEIEFDSITRQGLNLRERILEHRVEARTAISQLIGCEQEQVGLMHTTHEAINSCLWGMHISECDSILITTHEYPGVKVPLRHLCTRLGCELREVEWNASSDQEFVDTIKRSCDSTTRALVVSHVSWITGEIAPLRMLREQLPSNILIIVDGAQSAGALKVDMDDGWDAYSVSGQKWPCGPNGSGAVILKDPEAWLPTFGSYWQLEDTSDPLGSPILQDARRLETSQEAMLPLAGIASSIGWLTKTVGILEAEKNSRALNDYARMRVDEILADSCTSVSGEAHLFCINLGSYDALKLHAWLLEKNIATSAAAHNRIRLSLGAWTLKSEIDDALNAIATWCSEN